METRLTAKQVASLMGCTPRWVKELASKKKLQGGEKIIKPDGTPEWIFPLKKLDAPLQLKYYQNKADEFPGLI